MSPAISFSGEPRRGPFWRQILQGTKTCTTRRARKRGRPEPGQIAYLYWKQRQPISTTRRVKGEDLWTVKPIHKIGEAYILKVRRVRSLRALWDDEDYAIKEGFDGLDEMHRWWVPEMDKLPRGQLTIDMMPLLHRVLDQMGAMDVITWQYPLKEEGK